MQIGRIEGFTRELGKSQGYLGLPVKDVVLNCAVSGEGTRAMQTAWFPTPKEVEAIKMGAPIILTLHGVNHPPVMIDVRPSPNDSGVVKPIGVAEEKLVAAIIQLKATSEALKAKEIDGLEEGDIADLYEDIDLCLDHINGM